MPGSAREHKQHTRSLQHGAQTELESGLYPLRPRPRACGVTGREAAGGTPARGLLSLCTVTFSSSWHCRPRGSSRHFDL